MSALSCGPAWANVHVIYDSASLIPNGGVGGVLYDSIAWIGARDQYGVNGQYIGDSPLYGYLLCDSPDDGEGNPLYAASEVGIGGGGVFYAKGYGESSVFTDSWGSEHPIWTWVGGRGSAWFTVDHPTLSLHRMAEGFAGYDATGWTPALFETGWSIAVGKLTFSPEGTAYTPVYSTNSAQVQSTEGWDSIALDPGSTYQLDWSMSVKCSIPGEHGWAQLSVDLADLVEVPNVCGMNETEAKTELITSHLTEGTSTYGYSDTVPAGLVISQYPVAGTLVDDGSAVDIVISEGPRLVAVVVDVTADTITPSTKSITCNFWPPDGYGVADIVVESIRLQGTISPASTSIRKGQVLVVKFPTTGLGLQPGNVELTVTGQLSDGALFQGSDSITVVQRGGKK
jgi:hypothetical protein